MAATPKAKNQFQVKVPEPYKFLRKLGQGRFGSVYEVLKTGSDEHFAMKLLPFTSEEDFHKNEHEISKLKKNQHPNVVGFLEAIEGDMGHFVVLLPVHYYFQTVFRILKDVLDALAFLHSRNEVYGDLKPSNVLIGRDGTAKLGDFGGVVGVGTQKTSNPAECGTMEFWGPEFFVLGKNGPSPSQAGDMWAFGLLLLQLLTGSRWISGTNAVEISESVKQFDVHTNHLERLSSAELIRTGRLRSILGEETTLSQYISEELGTAKSQLGAQLSESERKNIQLEKEKEELMEKAKQLQEHNKKLQPVSQSQISPSQTSLFIGDLDPSTDEAHLRQWLVQTVDPNKIGEIRIVRDDATSESRLYGYLNFETHDVAREVLEKLNYSEVPPKRKQCRMMWCQPNASLRRNDDATLFVKNIAPSVTIHELHNLFRVYGTVLSVRLSPYHRKDIGHHGYVQFEKKEDAETALEKTDKMEVKGYTISVEKAKSPNSTKHLSVFVGNLAEDVKKEDLKVFFEPISQEAECIVVLDERGNTRGFGFAQFENEELAQLAVDEMNGKDLKGKPVELSIASTKKERITFKKKVKEEMKWRVLYIRNFPLEFTDEEFRALFEPYGKVTSCMISDRRPTHPAQPLMTPGFLDPRQLVQPQQHLQPPRQHVPPSQRPLSDLPTGFNMNEYREMADEDKKQYVGEFLYVKVVQMDAARAGQITGMILELGLEYSFPLLQDDSSLAQKIREAQGILGSV
ncbi:putative Polyadenylate-binding protein [Blattamonas nauphoetae]|uniref:Polyadenylate-binding protein n=1 Tax=Blattamonas nauphoetae TaxID=2049346 RepID=A0ABQ9X6Q4_9EUKA|nr:putative Polyadenylate-binding protein [Blattamonas nauphoetae]